MHNRFADSWNESLLLLEFLYSINDARQGVVDIIKSSVNKITFSHLPIQVADIEVIGSIISNCTKLNKLNFSNCSVDATFLDNLHALIKGSSVKVCLNFSTNSHNLVSCSKNQTLTHEQMVMDLILTTFNLRRKK